MEKMRHNSIKSTQLVSGRGRQNPGQAQTYPPLSLSSSERRGRWQLVGDQKDCKRWRKALNMFGHLRLCCFPSAMVIKDLPAGAGNTRDAGSIMLEKTLESPLDCKEVQPLNPKGNQS